jgi:hypothetical protein
MTHTAPHTDEIRYFCSRFPHDSYTSVKRAMRKGYKYPLRLSEDETAHLLDLDDDVIDSAQVLPIGLSKRKRVWLRKHPQETCQWWETIWFRDAETFTYVKMVTSFNSPSELKLRTK